MTPSLRHAVAAYLRDAVESLKGHPVGDGLCELADAVERGEVATRDEAAASVRADTEVLAFGDGAREDLYDIADGLHDIEDDADGLRAANIEAARAAERTPPDVRGLLLFGQRRGPDWDRFRIALAGAVERCNAREEPETLTTDVVLAIAREAVRS